VGNKTKEKDQKSEKNMHEEEAFTKEGWWLEEIEVVARPGLVRG
jgi:hypothetical protein